MVYLVSLSNRVVSILQKLRYLKNQVMWSNTMLRNDFKVKYASIEFKKCQQANLMSMGPLSVGLRGGGVKNRENAQKIAQNQCFWAPIKSHSATPMTPNFACRHFLTSINTFVTVCKYEAIPSKYVIDDSCYSLIEYGRDNNHITLIDALKKHPGR